MGCGKGEACAREAVGARRAGLELLMCILTFTDCFCFCFSLEALGAFGLGARGFLGPFFISMT